MRYVSDGFRFELKEDLQPLDRNEFRVFEGIQAYYILKEVVTNLKLGKFLGVFPPECTEFRGRPMLYCPLFPIEKGDSTAANPKFRVIFNAAAEQGLSRRQQAIMNNRFISQSHYDEFVKEPFIKTFNENMQSIGIRLDLVHSVIQGLYKCKLLWGLDLHKGYRHLIRASSD